MTLRDLAKNRAEASRDWGISATKNQPSPIIEFEQISLRGYSSRFSCVPLFFQKWQCDSKFYLWLYFSFLCFAFLQGGKRFGYLLILSDAIWNSDLLRKIRWSIAIFQKKKKKCGFPSLVICRAQTLVVGLFLPYFLFPPLSCVIASFTQFPPFFFFFFWNFQLWLHTFSLDLHLRITKPITFSTFLCSFSHFTSDCIANNLTFSCIFLFIFWCEAIAVFLSEISYLPLLSLISLSNFIKKCKVIPFLSFF